MRNRYAIGLPNAAPRMIVTGTDASIAMTLGMGEVAIVITDEPPAPCRINAAGTALEAVTPPLATLRTARWTEARAWRDARQGGTCVTPLGVVDIDPESQRRIVGAVTAAMVAGAAGQPFPSIGWTMADNRVVAHDADALAAMGLTVVAFIDACQQAGTAIRVAIEAADSAEDLAAIDITAGYPA